jgi:hypothetical protein
MEELMQLYEEAFIERYGFDPEYLYNLNQSIKKLETKLNIRNEERKKCMAEVISYFVRKN